MTTDATTTGLRRCIGSTKFGIEAHEAPPDEFPAQPSQKGATAARASPTARSAARCRRSLRASQR